ncbi:MAG: hypothetical protein HZC01_00995 [Candidatus Kerfeldbacteria bacterium]|nr:hypothetical protein [Candidatus Kerfeldbacteria bacterium]
MNNGATQKNQLWTSITLLVVVALLIGVYFIWASTLDEDIYSPAQLLTNSAINPVPGEHLYKTYVNDELGFRIQYPQEWFVEVTSSGASTDNVYSVQFRGESEGAIISVMPPSLESVVRGSLTITSETTISVNGWSGQRLVATSASNGSEGYTVIIDAGEHLYVISGGGQTFDEIVDYFELL